MNRPEPSRRVGFDQNEQRIADHLRLLGHDVVAVPARHAEGIKTPDALVDGTPIDFKAVHGNEPIDRRMSLPTSTTTIRNILNRIDLGQAEHFVIDARGTTLTEGQALDGLRRALAGQGRNPASVRIVGADFDIRWSR